MSSSSEPRLRNSCESCRRKKAKCTGERPACSFCQRLGQACVYLAREQHQPRAQRHPGVVKASASKERVKRLETQVGQIYDMLQSLADQRSKTSTSSAPQSSQSPEGNSDQSGGGDQAPDHPEGLQAVYLEREDTVDLPAEVISYFTGVYRRSLAFNPLPLFLGTGLQERVPSWPRYLRWSFLALTLRFSRHPFFRGQDAQAADFYARLAYGDIYPLTMEGVAKLEVVQSLCLLALHDLKVANPARAWSTIGVAARLEMSRGWNRRDDLSSWSRNADDEDSCGCYWSVYILEKVFSAECSVLDRCVVQPRYPSSASPPPPPDLDDSLDQATVMTTKNSDLNSGVNSSFLRVISIWGDVTSYIHGIRCTKLEHPWLPSSRYTQLTQKMYKFEDQTALEHLLKNTAFMDRSPREISDNLDYWRPWILMQLTHHATTAVLNHPFIHVVGLRGTSHRAPPRLFMQGVIDQALYHSQWVGRLIQACESLRFEIHEPLLGTLVAATATVAWVFRFAPDNAAAAKAAACFDKCEDFVKNVGDIWPHIGQKAKLLKSLRGVSGQTRSDGDSVITFRPSRLWELLDNSIIPTDYEHSSVSGPGSRGSPLSDATLNVTTNILHPVDENGGQSSSPATARSEAHTQAGDDQDQLFFDSFFTHYMPTEMSWMPDAAFQL